ncbi:MAG: GGDEF domain-containing protein [Clostridia bacterium]|nr:GGDEF domain-containing protein [Clostridia bacterium]
MEGILYCTLNIFCVSILVLILLQIIKSNDRRMSQFVYSCFIISSAILCGSDLLWGIVDASYVWKFSDSVDFMVNSIYHIFTLVTAYMWYLYSESEMETRTTTTKKGLALSLVPLILGVSLIVASYKHNLVFFIDSDGVYQRGSLYIAHIAICFFYIVLTSTKAFVRSFNKDNYLKRARYRTLAYFCIFPLIYGVLQIVFVGSPMISAGVTFAAIQVYVRSRQELISVDPLTKLNNRAEMERYIDHKIKNRNSNRDLYLFIMDMDYFKKINDKFGHTEGDEAITIAADAIRNAIVKTGLNAFRYGGDEFVVSGEVKADFNPDEFCILINEKLKEETEKRDKEYVLHMSVGYFKYTQDIKDIREFIASADEYLYKRKSERALKLSN